LHVGAHRVSRLGLHREVERRGLGSRLLTLEDLDAALGADGEELLDLLDAETRLMQCRGDAQGLEVALLAALG
jgi:hypothetical protein